jgi:hypothetical protein
MSNRTTALPEKSDATLAPVRSVVLQRKCACGNHAMAGECQECGEKNGLLQRSARNPELETRNALDVPPIVHEVVRSPGQVLASAPPFMEPGFGNDFSRVRVQAEDLPRVSGSAMFLDPHLPANIPAWTEKGNVHLGSAVLFMPPRERQRVLRHETIHALHQKLTGTRETHQARQHAENLAQTGEGGAAALDFAEFLRSAPTRLMYPPQTHSPWSKVWIGYAGVIGEVVESGVTVRIFVKYEEDLKIKRMPEYKAYECGKHDIKPIPDIVKKIKQVTAKTAQMNDKLPGAAAQRVALVAIFGDSSNAGYRTTGGKGLIVLGRDEFDAGTFESTIAHEGSHAIFEYHAVRGGAKSRVPDAFALGIADLYVALSATKAVPEPTSKFDKKVPPPLLIEKDTSARPAGIIMVMDTLWSGKGGHPWDNVDEFFASAYAGFTQEPKLFREIIGYYEKFDSTIKPLSAKLLSLLRTVGVPKKYRKLKVPAQPEEAKRELGRVAVPLDITKEHPAAGWLIDPGTMPSPDKIDCSVSTTTDVDIDKLGK